MSKYPVSITTDLGGRNRLLCPDCNAELTSYQSHEIVVERCTQCLGIWFNKAGLNLFRKELHQLNLNALTALPKTLPPNGFLISCCPTCTTPIDSISDSKYKNVEFKKCSLCLGFWLSWSDLVMMIEQLKMSDPH